MNIEIKDYYNYFEYASLLISILFYKKYKSYSFYKFFVLYLINLVLFEVMAQIIDKTHIKELFNIYTFLEFNLFVFIYYHLINEKGSLKLLKILALAFNIIYFISFFFNELSKITVPLEAIVNSVFIILYFRELLKSEKVLSYKKLLPFWISVGFLIFYLTTIPFFTLYYFELFNLTSFPIFHFLIIVFHLCLIFGLIICRKTKN